MFAYSTSVTADTRAPDKALLRRRLCAFITGPLPEGRPTRDQTEAVPLSNLADWAVRFSPLVEPLPPNALLADITGCEHLFGGEAALARQFSEGLARLGWDNRVAVAETVGAAYALACAGTEPRVVVPPGQARDFLAPLPVAALRIDPPICQQLARIGVCAVGELLRLPRSALAMRFGPQPVLRLQQALGEVFEGVATRYPPTVPGSRLEFDPPAKELPKIEPAVDLLLRELFLQMQQRNRALRQLECILYGPHRPPRVLSIEFVRPCRAQKHVAALLKQRLERVRLSEGVSGLAVVARQTAPWRPEQADLFSGQVSREAEELTGLLDRLVNRLGHDAVVQAELQEDYQPEAAFRYVPIGQALERARGSRPASAGVTAGRLRPTVLLPRPQPIRVISQVPDGPPSWLSFGGREHLVARVEGPERLETGWWRGPDLRRDYFRVTTTTGRQFWIFRDLVKQCWYLHGVFS